MFKVSYQVPQEILNATDALFRGSAQEHHILLRQWVAASWVPVSLTCFSSKFRDGWIMSMEGFPSRIYTSQTLALSVLEHEGWALTAHRLTVTGIAVVVL